MRGHRCPEAGAGDGSVPAGPPVLEAIAQPAAVPAAGSCDRQEAQLREICLSTEDIGDAKRVMRNPGIAAHPGQFLET
jgi:hypothetical protein